MKNWFRFYEDDGGLCFWLLLTYAFITMVLVAGLFVFIFKLWEVLGLS